MNTIIKDIYLISCKNSTHKGCYIGQTGRLKRRSLEHKHNCNNELSKAHHRPIYQYIRSHGGWDNFEMKKIHSIEGTQIDIDKLEKFYIKKYKSLNIQIPTRTRQEYVEDNREKILLIQKNYYYTHHDVLLKKKKEVINCLCGATYTRTHRARHMATDRHFNNLIMVV